MKLSKERLFRLGVVLVEDDAGDYLKCKLCDCHWFADQHVPKFWLCENGCNNLLTKP